MKMPELKPCPFCGSNPIIDKYIPPQPHSVAYAVQCVNINCAVRPITDYCKDRKFIIKQWNRRATDENT